MKKLISYIRAIGKNPYLEIVAGILIIGIAVYEFAEDVEKSFHAFEGLNYLLLFGLFYLARTVSISFDGLESIDSAESSKFHQKNTLVRVIHRVTHSPIVEMAIGGLLFVVGFVEIWENVREEMIDFERWHIGLIILGVYLILRSFTAFVKSIVLLKESGYFKKIHVGWMQFVTSPMFESAVGVSLLIAGIIEEIYNLSTADPFEVQEYHAFIVFGIVNILKFFPDAYDGIVLTEA